MTPHTTTDKVPSFWLDARYSQEHNDFVMGTSNTTLTQLTNSSLYIVSQTNFTGNLSLSCLAASYLTSNGSNQRFEVWPASCSENLDYFCYKLNAVTSVNSDSY
jgi:hypothetical protein